MLSVDNGADSIPPSQPVGTFINWVLNLQNHWKEENKKPKGVLIHFQHPTLCIIMLSVDNGADSQLIDTLKTRPT